MLPTVSIVLALALATAAVAAPARPPALSWSRLPDLPPAPGQTHQRGLAGPFVGVSNSALLLAGGANFPDKLPWDGGRKVWWDDVYVLLEGEGGAAAWQTDPGWKLPRALAYGVSVTDGQGLVCIGGCDADTCYREVFSLRWDAGARRVRVKELPPLPRPLAFMTGADVSGTIYVAGGQESMSGGRATKSFWALDLSGAARGGGAAWRELPPWPGPPRVLAVAAAQSNGTNMCLYLFSGRNVQPGKPTEMLTDAYCFDPSAAGGSGAWHRLPDVGAPTAQPGCVMAATAVPWGTQQILVIGGAAGVFFRRAEALGREIAAVKGQLDAAADGDGAEALRRQVETLERVKHEHVVSHPGFLPAVHVYDTAAGTWARADALPTETPPVTTTAVGWQGRIVLPSGEIHPGIRTPSVWQGGTRPE